MVKKERKRRDKKRQQNLIFGQNSTIVYGAAIAAVFVIVAAIVFWPENGYQIPADYVPEVTGAPHLVLLDGDVIDHGDVPVNQYVRSQFRVQNMGDQVLTLETSDYTRIVEGCWQQPVNVSSTSLQPGQEGTISLHFTMGPGMEGPHDFRIHLRTNDPENDAVELAVLSNWVNQ